LEGGLVFGSELRTIIPLLKDKTPDHASVYEYFRLGYIARDRSIFKKVKKLLPGHYLHYKNGEAKIDAYWKLSDTLGDPTPTLTDKEWQRDMHDILAYAFGKRMVSDVPVGVFLSGGIDSSLVTSVLQKNYGGIHTFTIGFDDPRFNEANIAKEVAQHLGTEHTEFILNMNDAYETLQSFYEIYDEPFSDSSGIPSTIVSKLAAQAGIKVVLSGDGGDEMFAGYSRYNTSLSLYNKLHKIPSPARKALSAAARGVYNSRVLKKVYSGNCEHKVAALSELLSANDLGHFYSAYLSNQSDLELRSMLRHTSEGVNDVELISEDMEGIMNFELHHYLPDDLLVKMDRATMHNSIEGREPFLDHTIIEFAAKMPMHLKQRNGQSKWILRQILGEYIPEHLFNRPKKGFSIPIFKWFSEHMDNMFEHYLTYDRLEKTGIFNTDEVLHEYNKYKWNKKHNKEYNIEKMWRLLSFMMWWDRWNEKL
jgi:asparagine synthase (glutamine-hydrolysing)